MIQPERQDDPAKWNETTPPGETKTLTFKSRKRSIYRWHQRQANRLCISSLLSSHPPSAAMPFRIAESLRTRHETTLLPLNPSLASPSMRRNAPAGRHISRTRARTGETLRESKHSPRQVSRGDAAPAHSFEAHKTPGQETPADGLIENCLRPPSELQLWIGHWRVAGGSPGTMVQRTRETRQNGLHWEKITLFGWP